MLHNVPFLMYFSVIVKNGIPNSICIIVGTDNVNSASPTPQK